MSERVEIIELYRRRDVAETFDEERDVYKYQKFKHFIESKILRNVINKRGLRVLDVACGTGRMLSTILDKNIDYTGIDTSEEMVNILKSKIKRTKQLNKIKILMIDATKLPFKDGVFDVVYTYHLLWHVPVSDQERIIKEMIRVTKPGGTILFDIINKEFVWERIKNWFGLKKLAGIHKLSLNDVEQMIGTRDYKLDKIFDIQINDHIYPIFNLINRLQGVLHRNIYHMLYFSVKK